MVYYTALVSEVAISLCFVAGSVLNTIILAVYVKRRAFRAQMRNRSEIGRNCK